MIEPTQSEHEMVEEFATDMAALVRAVPQAHRDATAKALGGIYGMLLALRRHVRELEARPTLKYAGVWDPNHEYAENSSSVVLVHCGSPRYGARGFNQAMDRGGNLS